MRPLLMQNSFITIDPQGQQYFMGAVKVFEKMRIK